MYLDGDSGARIAKIIMQREGMEGPEVGPWQGGGEEAADGLG